MFGCQLQQTCRIHLLSSRDATGEFCRAVSLRVVLVEPTHPGNVGAVARAMGNMGVSELILVNPVDFLNEEAFARSANNESILEKATVCGRLEEALADCSLIFGTSARLRTIEWPSCSAREAMNSAAMAVSKGSNAAILFGPERTGLANEAVDLCTELIRIPVDEKAPSINLAGAVLIMLYEYHLAMLELSSTGKLNVEGKVLDSAASAQIQGFFDHLEKVIRKVEFIGNEPHTSLMRKIKRIFVRSQLTEDDVNILRGILTAVAKKVGGKDSQ